jgi:hypothetical protein
MKTSLRRRFSKYKKRIALTLVCLTAFTAAVTNIDKLATLWSKHFGKTNKIEALSDAVNQALPPQFNRLVELELVQAPKNQDKSQVFDVYLKNKTNQDLLLTKMAFGAGFIYTSATINGSEKFFPNSSYQIPVRGPAKQSLALSPPYLLKAGSRGAIRFTFSPSDRPIDYPLAFELYSSSGVKVAVVNGFFGEQ